MIIWWIYFIVDLNSFIRWGFSYGFRLNEKHTHGGIFLFCLLMSWDWVFSQDVPYYIWVYLYFLNFCLFYQLKYSSCLQPSTVPCWESCRKALVRKEQTHLSCFKMGGAISFFSPSSMELIIINIQVKAFSTGTIPLCMFSLITVFLLYLMQIYDPTKKWERYTIHGDWLSSTRQIFTLFGVSVTCFLQLAKVYFLIRYRLLCTN